MRAGSRCSCGGATARAGPGMRGPSIWGCSSPGFGTPGRSPAGWMPTAARRGRCWPGRGNPPARGARRINGVLAAVRGMVTHAVAAGQAPAHLVPLLYEVADDGDLPAEARGEQGRMAHRLRARHRLREDERPVDRASDAEVTALLRSCLSARDRLVVMPMAPDSASDLITAAAHRAGLARVVTPHQLRHAFGSNVADAGGAADEIADLMGHGSLSSTKVYLHPDPAWLRAAVERVPSPRLAAGEA